MVQLVQEKSQKPFSAIDHIVDKSVIQLPDGALKELGDYSITLLFHPEVSCVVEVSVLPE
jgi:large subunit ribosomal protein L9